MPVPTPFHPRTARLCTSMLWKDWSGFFAVRSFDTCHDREYFAIRHAAGVIDVSPLFKYDIRGPQAGAFLARVLVRDPSKLKPGRVSYLCWCDDAGKVLDDGTVSRLEEDHFRLTANGPSLHWLLGNAAGFRVDIEDSSAKVGALAIQGPNSRDILKRVSDADLDTLRFFGVTRARVEDVEVHISRTGYTGDLGYEVWVGVEDALAVWDAIMRAGKPYRIEPVGLDAMDVARVEAGYILSGVDYYPAHTCLIESRKSSPYEIGLGWTVRLRRDPFIGQAALVEEKKNGSQWARVGLIYDWNEYEAIFAEFGLPPALPATTWRTAVPITDARGRQVGQATSGTWSPVLKQNIAIATVLASHGTIGTRLRVEVTVEYERRWVTATVSETPFFDPERKRA